MNCFVFYKNGDNIMMCKWKYENQQLLRNNPRLATATVHTVGFSFTDIPQKHMTLLKA